MSAFGKKLRHWAGDDKYGYHFWCPGCNETHSVQTSAGGWSFNSNSDRPTFSPSVLVRTGHHTSHFKQGDNCWCAYNAEQIAKGEKPAPFVCYVCHSFVTDGRIQFLTDCTHALAGQTVDLPDYPQRGES